MTQRAVQWSQRAKEDLEAIWMWIGERNPEAAEAIARRLFDTAESLSGPSWKGRPRDEISPGLRSLYVSGYLIFYEILEPGVVIIRVLHGARDVFAALSDPDEQG